MSLPWELGQTPEVVISAEEFEAYHSKILHAPQYEIKFRWNTLSQVDGEPQHWPRMIEDEQLSVTQLREALTKTFQIGVLETASRHQYYDRPSGHGTFNLGRARLMGLISLVNAYDEHEPLPAANHDMQQQRTDHWALTPKTGLTSVNLFEYTDRLRYRRSTFIDKTAIRFCNAHMHRRLPHPVAWGSYSYDYEAYEQGAIYPIENGVAFSPQRPQAEYRDPVEELVTKKPSWRLLRPYTEPAVATHYRGLTPAALAEAALDTQSVKEHHLNLFSYSALLKYTKALRRAGMHDVRPPLPT